MMNSLLITLATLALAAQALAEPQVVSPSSLPPLLPPSSVATGSAPDPAPAPAKTSGAPSGPICECGYTYCAAVLMKMSMFPLSTLLDELTS